MGWMYILISLVVLIAILLALSRTCAIVFSKILTKIVKRDVSIDYVGFFSLKNIAVSFLDSSVVVDDIWLSWRLINSKQKYPAALHIGDVRIRADAGVKCNTSTHPSPPLVADGSSREQTQKSGSSGLVTSWLISLGKSLITLMSFHLEAINVMFLNTVGEDSLLHISINKCQIEGSSQTNRKLNGKFTVGQAAVKVLSSTEAQSKQKKSFVLQASTSVSAEVVLDVVGKLCDVASVSLSNTSVSVVDEFLTTLQKHLQSRHHQERVTSVQERDSGIQKALQKLPGEIQLTLDKTDLSLTSGVAHRGIHLCLEHFQAKNSLTPEKKFVKFSAARTLQLPHGEMLISLKSMEVTTKSSNKLLCILNSAVSLQLSDGGLASSIHLNSFHMHLPVEEMSFWMPSISSADGFGGEVAEVFEEEYADVYELPEEEMEKSSITENWVLPVTFDLALNNTSVQLTPKGSPSFLSEVKVVKVETVHTPGSEEHILETKGSVEVKELLCRVGTEPFKSCQIFLHNSHVFGSPCSLENSRFVYQFLPDLCHVDLTVQSLQLETSPDLIRFCKSLSKMLPSPKERKARPPRRPVKTEPAPELEASFKMEDFSVFLISTIPCSVIFHVDSLSAGTAENHYGSEIEGIMLQCFDKQSQTFSLSAIEFMEGGSMLLNIREVNIKHNGSRNEFSCIIPDGFFSSWDTTSHMTLFHHSRELVQFGQEMRAIFSPPPSTVTKTDASDEPSSSKSKFSAVDVSVQITFLQFSYQLSAAKCNSITIQECFIQKEGSVSLKASCPEVVFDFEGHEVITLKSACIEQLINNDHHLEVRKGFEKLELPSNWGIGFYTSSIDIVFPWKYDFAANYSEIISINKWLKKVHGKKRSPDNPPIYPDLVLRCQEFTLKFGDDPFEVKLGDNYELMKDERMESDRRQSLLDNKVEDLKNQHGQLLPASKIEELYTSLEKKNLEIFVKRSQKLYSTSPMRTALLTLEISSIEINALCDSSMNGKDNIIKHMKEIDHASRFPEGGLDFITLWCRMVQGHLKSFDLKLRDYPQSLWVIKDMHWWGRLIGAEQVAKPRATREVPVEVKGVWGNDTVIRSMPPLKFFHDLATDVKEWRLAWGPSFEPAWAQINLCLNLLNKPSVDPSPPLPFWDKIRLLYHGRLVASIEQMNLYWLAMKNPYQTTELLDWEWRNFYMDWQNAHFLLKSDLDIFVRTASKYDDVRLLHLPNLKFEISLEWLCQGDCNDHHSVLVCAPDKVPEYSSNQKHDSYAAFRTYNLNLSLNLDIRGYKKGDSERLPSCLFYSSTMRWLQNFQSRVLANVTRPTRKGKLFNNTNPRKLQLSRHYKFIELCASFPSMQVNYWASFAQRQGMELNLGKGSFKSKYSLKLEPIEDGLIHRPRANWSIVGLDFEVVDNQAYLYTTDSGEEVYLLSKSSAQKHHLASVAKVVYARQQAKTLTHEISESVEECEDYETEAVGKDATMEKEFIHKLVVHEFCGSWTRFNRDVFFSLYDAYRKVQTLKQNLSTEALKGIKVDANPPTHKFQGVLSPQSSVSPSFGTPSGSAQIHSNLNPSPMTKLQGGHGATMLQQLLAETSTKFMVFSEESTNDNEQLYGVKACNSDDVIQHNWLIEFVNSQLMLKGLDSSGYVLVTAANAELMQRSHLPSWREEGKLASKTTWVGTLEGLQYFATVDTPSGQGKDKVQWLPPSLIEKGTPRMTDIPDMVGSGESVGGVVNDTVGPSAKDLSWESVQVQRIISRCGCQFFFALYGDDVDPEVAAQMLHSSKEMGGNDEEENILDREEAVDSLTLIYHDLDICTNSTQYNMIVDTLNNLLLYVEPKRKEALARTQHMMFALQLSSIEDQKGPIMQLQNSLRNLISHLREVEKELYDVHWASEKAPNDQSLMQKTSSLELQLYDIKMSMMNAAEDLRIMVSCFQEIQLQMALKRKLQNAQSLKTTRRVELCFGVAKWKLTESDGQLGTADMELRHFKYTRISRDDDSGDNIFELGYITINNLLANDVYKEVLRPQDPSGNQVVLRVITRGRPPVGGISVTEKFELSVVPLSIQLTYRFFKKMMAFFFPRHNVDQEGAEDSLKGLDEEDSSGSMRSNKSTTINSSTSSLRSTATIDSNSSGTLSSQGSLSKHKRKQKNETDIDKMKERASRNTSFFYIKIPAVPLSVSYKGEKEKNIEDVSNFKLTLPSLEYHNCTWTWLDLLMAMKKEYKQAVLSQAIKEKLKFKISHKEEGASGSETREDVDKAKLLMGDKLTTILQYISDTCQSRGMKSILGEEHCLEKVKEGRDLDWFQQLWFEVT